jgi:hypothetical protein
VKVVPEEIEEIFGSPKDEVDEKHDLLVVWERNFVHG